MAEDSLARVNVAGEEVAVVNDSSPPRSFRHPSSLRYLSDGRAWASNMIFQLLF